MCVSGVTCQCLVECHGPLPPSPMNCWLASIHSQENGCQSTSTFVQGLASTALATKLVTGTTRPSKMATKKQTHNYSESLSSMGTGNTMGPPATMGASSASESHTPELMCAMSPGVQLLCVVVVGGGDGGSHLFCVCCLVRADLRGRRGWRQQRSQRRSERTWKEVGSGAGSGAQHVGPPNKQEIRYLGVGGPGNSVWGHRAWLGVSSPAKGALQGPKTKRSPVLGRALQSTVPVALGALRLRPGALERRPQHHLPWI